MITFKADYLLYGVVSINQKHKTYSLLLLCLLTEITKKIIFAYIF